MKEQDEQPKSPDQQNVWDHAEIEKIADFLVKRGWVRRGNMFQRPYSPDHSTIAEAIFAEFVRPMGAGKHPSWRR